MDLQNAAAIAEIVGVITIVITFLFLGLQIRESNRATRAATYQAITQTETMRFISIMPLKYTSDCVAGQALAYIRIMLSTIQIFRRKIQNKQIDGWCWTVLSTWSRVWHPWSISLALLKEPVPMVLGMMEMVLS